MLQPPQVGDAPSPPAEQGPQEGAAQEAPADVDPELARFYTQQMAWSDCGPRHQCARVQVPMDYADPGAEHIEVAIKVAAAQGSSQGALLTNPGGPGSSGLEFLESVDETFSAELLAGFDVVGFDPRGVGDSDAVHCLDSAALDEYYGQTFALDTDAGWQDFVDAHTDYGQACLENTGDLLGFVDTISAARDLDIIRAVLGQTALTYLGFSYGTFLGATYAELFPDRVHRMVLDAAMDPTLSYTEIARGQVLGFDRAYRSFIADCQAGPHCPLTDDVQAGIEQTADLLTTLGDDPMPSADPDRPVTDTDLINTIIITLYNTQSWPVLTEALRMLIDDGDASQVRLISDIALEREEDGTYPPDEGAFRAINCLDFPAELDRDQSMAAARSMAEESEVFGDYFGYGDVGCATMPFDATGTRGAITAPGTPPILVIGTTGDPATPYEWAQALAGQLESGILLTRDGEGHTAYGGNDACVDEVVDDFLLSGQVPNDGMQC